MKTVLLFISFFFLSFLVSAQKMQFQKYAFVRPHNNLKIIKTSTDDNFDVSEAEISAGSSGISFGAGFDGLKFKRRFLLGVDAGWQVNSLVMKGSHSQFQNYEFREVKTQHAPFVKFHLGVIVGKIQESFFSIQFGLGVQFPLTQYKGDGLVYDTYLENGTQRHSPVLYYQYETESYFEDVFAAGIFSIGPYYQSKKLFGNSALRIGVDFSARITGRADEMVIAEFKGGGGDRTKVSEQRSNFSKFNIGLNVGLTF